MYPCLITWLTFYLTSVTRLHSYESWETRYIFLELRKSGKVSTYCGKPLVVELQNLVCLRSLAKSKTCVPTTTRWTSPGLFSTFLRGTLMNYGRQLWWSAVSFQYQKWIFHYQELIYLLSVVSYLLCQGKVLSVFLRSAGLVLQWHCHNQLVSTKKKLDCSGHPLRQSCHTELHLGRLHFSFCLRFRYLPRMDLRTSQ